MNMNTRQLDNAQHRYFLNQFDQYGEVRNCWGFSNKDHALRFMCTLDQAPEVFCRLWDTRKQIAIAQRNGSIKSVDVLRHS